MIERDTLMLEFKQFLPLISEENVSIIRDIIDVTRGRMNVVFKHIGDEIRTVGAIQDHRRLVIHAGEERVHAMYEKINQIIANTDSFNLFPENVKVDVSEKGPDVVIRIKPCKKDDAPNICAIDKTYPNN